ncbi:hypothetical protein AF335_07750 [Streptomyces eurocidicus]|uniref:Uncharacterized protein n=1 Tax=Streptomyces eurocidicus TaxID=66423 RepID=A0A2N8P0C5_STREU|nr:hypothetical protein [Streptomyces eurocidicus]MBB5121713.1 hypothetical protein [Streptomyces eurocidicus]MBF6052935.1 hypothetical protein [Streptomyces eurocidicus]PNE34470.1 hypothetical protein AF335_07750 [Streptomyces eurocidicus]
MFAAERTADDLGPLPFGMAWFDLFELEGLRSSWSPTSDDRPPLSTGQAAPTVARQRGIGADVGAARHDGLPPTGTEPGRR